MIPDVLCQLISKYNEIGIFTLSYDSIYWFNGKRFEHWCQSPPNHDAIWSQNGILYVFDRHHHSWMSYKNFNWNHIDYDLNVTWSRFDCYFDNTYTFKYKVYDNYKSTILEKSRNFNAHVRSIEHKDEIYCFGLQKSYVYCHKRNIWSKLPDNKQRKMVILILALENKLYLVYDDLNMMKFNLKNFVWTKMDLKAPLESQCNFYSMIN